MPESKEVDEAEVVEEEASEAKNDQDGADPGPSEPDIQTEGNEESEAPPVDNQAPQSVGQRGTWIVAVIALLLGFGGAYFWTTQNTQNNAEIDRLAAQIEDLKATVAEPQPDTASEAVTQLQSALSGELQGLGAGLGTLADRLNTLDERMSLLETTPSPDAPAEFAEVVSDLRGAASEAQAENARLGNQLSEAREQIQALRAENEGLSAELEELRAALALVEADRGMSNEQMAARAGNAIAAALIQGKPFEADLAVLKEATGEDIPPALALVSAEGAIPEMQLLKEFPDLARLALVDALKAKSDGNVGARAIDFVKLQLGARTVAPKEGDDPDAILSRAQAAVDESDLKSALVEVESLSGPASEVFKDWQRAARARVDAEAALAQLNLG